MGKGNVYTLLVQVQSCTSTLEICLEVPPKARNRFIQKSSYTIPGYITKGLYILLQKYLHLYRMDVLFHPQDLIEPASNRYFISLKLTGILYHINYVLKWAMGFPS